MDAWSEVSVDAENLSAVCNCLSQLTRGDGPLGHQDNGGEVAVSAVGGGGGAGVARGGADDRGALRLHRLGDRHHHAAVLERAGRIAPLQLQVYLLASHLVGKVPGGYQRRVALSQRHPGGIPGYREQWTVSAEHPYAHRWPVPVLRCISNGSGVGIFIV